MFIVLQCFSTVPITISLIKKQGSNQYLIQQSYMLHTFNISYKCAKNRIIILSHITDITLVSLPFTQSLPSNPIHHQSSHREFSFFLAC